MAGGHGGGVPYVLRDAAVTTGVAPAGGRKVTLPTNICYLIVRVHSEDCKLYFTQADYEADENYVYIYKAGANYPYGEWRGPVETAPGSHSDLWLRADANTADVELVAFQRRG